MNLPDNNYLSKANYLPHIDGLRAIAILSVIIYHAFPDYIPGGFTGVDIFFVISGFLISRIVFTELHAKKFSLIIFYVRRIRRIFPALLLVLFSSLIAGWFLLLADELKQLGLQSLAGAAFFENLLLLGQEGYFNTASELKPLMHLWSLAIEEQYYLAYPLLLWVLWPHRKFLFVIIFLATLLSFIGNVIYIRHDAASTFFLPQTRIWELLAGGLLAYRQLFFSETSFYSKNFANKNFAAILGLGFIAGSLFLIDKQSLFPGWWALLPISGALLLIYSGPDTWINRYLLSQKLLVGIGLISYPLYLWHWPLLSFAHILGGEAPSVAIRMGMLGVSILLAVTTYQLIEKPVRTVKSSVSAAILLSLMAAAGAAGYTIYYFNGFPGRDAERNQFDLYYSTYGNHHKIENIFRMDCGFLDWTDFKSTRQSISSDCYTPHSEEKIFLWGDSHVQHLNSGLKKILPETISLLQVATSSCPADIVKSKSNNAQEKRCNLSNQFALEKIKVTKPQIVIIAQLWGHDGKDFETIARQLKAIGVKQIILIGPVPRWDPYLYKVIVKNYWLNTPKRISTNLVQEVFTVDKQLKKIYSHSTDIAYISVADYLCNEKGCLTYLGKDISEGLETLDYGHFTEKTSEYFAKDILMPFILKNIQ